MKGLAYSIRSPWTSVICCKIPSGIINSFSSVPCSDAELAKPPNYVVGRCSCNSEMLLMRCVCSKSWNNCPGGVNYTKHAPLNSSPRVKISHGLINLSGILMTISGSHSF